MEKKTSSFKLNWLSMFVSINVSAVLPVLLYQYLTKRQHVSSAHALLAGAAVVGLYSIGKLIISRKIDTIAVLSVAGILIAVIASFISGSQRLILVRESFITGMLGIASLLSLFRGRPLFFFLARQMLTKTSEEHEKFNAGWHNPDSQHFYRVITLVWGIGLTVDFVVRVTLAYTLTVSEALAATPIITNVFVISLIIWMLAYVRRFRSAHPVPAA